MLHPASARAIANEQPRPRAAPVMTATFPVRSCYVLSVKNAMLFRDLPCCCLVEELMFGVVLNQ